MMMKNRMLALGSLAAILIGVLAALGVFTGTAVKAPAPQEGTEQRAVQEAPFTATLPDAIEAVETPSEREKGLSGREEIPDGYGMLFVFEESGHYGFWMKEMLVPIDIVWIAEDGTIVNVSPAVAPETYPEVLMPPSPVRYVLETRAGYAEDAGWEAGDRFDLSAYAK